MPSIHSLKRSALILVLPLVVAACQPAEKSAQTANLDPGEQACAAQAASAAGIDATTVTVAKTSSTTEGDSIYVATAGAQSYMCVLSPTQQMLRFEQQ